MMPDYEKKRRQKERQDWFNLKKLADSGDLKGFWTYYADYLERNNIYSGSREILYNMAVKTVEELNVKS